MKERELREHSNCSICTKKLLHTGVPLFWRVTIERFGIDLGAIQRQTGLAMMLGSASVAAAMGPDEDMAKLVMEPLELAVCDTCAVDADMPLAALSEFCTPKGTP